MTDAALAMLIEKIAVAIEKAHAPQSVGSHARAVWIAERVIPILDAYAAEQTAALRAALIDMRVRGARAVPEQWCFSVDCRPALDPPHHVTRCMSVRALLADCEGHT